MAPLLSVVVTGTGTVPLVVPFPPAVPLTPPAPPLRVELAAPETALPVPMGAPARVDVELTLDATTTVAVPVDVDPLLATMTVAVPVDEVTPVETTTVAVPEEVAVTVAVEEAEARASGERGQHNQRSRNRLQTRVNSLLQ